MASLSARYLTPCVRYPCDAAEARADRLLSIMLLLRQRGLVTATELAERLEVSERTVLRDMEALSFAGVPVVAERGRHGGFRLLEGFRADLANLDDVEAQVLLASVGLDTFGDLGLSREVHSALQKVPASAPERVAAPASRLRDVVHVDRRRWFAEADDATHLPALRSAAVERRRVRIVYTRAAEERPRVSTVDPLGVVENGTRWYLVAYHRGSPRAYRLGRISGLTVLDSPARLPDDARLVEVWTTLRRDLEGTRPAPTVVHVRVRAEVVEDFRTTVRPMVVGAITAVPSADAAARDADQGVDDAGWVDLTCAFRAPTPAIGVTVGFGGDVEIVGPPELRARAVVLLRGTAARHGLLPALRLEG